MQKTTTTNSKVLKSLIPETTYEYKIRTKCLDDEFGDYTALNNFTTLTLREAEMNERSFIEVYPNPANAHVMVSVETTFVNGMVVLMDITGKVVYSQVLEGANTTIYINNLTSGLYIISLNLDGNIVTEKLVKE